MTKHSFFPFLLVCVNICVGQANTVGYEPTLRFPMNDPAKTFFLHDLNDFLNRYTSPESVTRPDLMTMPLTDELRDIRLSVTMRNPYFFRPYLENIVLLRDMDYFIQLSFLATKDTVPLRRASFELIARRNNDHFVFLSPLQKNIHNWKSKTCENMQFIFPDSIDLTKAYAFARLDSFYNSKINALNQQTAFIKADDFPDALRLIGVSYKSDYAGEAYSSLSDYSDGKRIVISGRQGSFPSYDPHDTWHEKLRTVMADSVINRPVDEGCAYLFGGSWGFTWHQVLDSFKLYVSKHPHSDWLSLYKNDDKFKFGNYSNGIANMLNALLIEKIQQEKGFPAVMTLLSCGPREKGDANYFRCLRSVTGITEMNFNKEIDKLLK